MFGRASIAAPALALLLSATARAQAPTITLREAVSRALASHPDLRAADADVAIARGELLAARTFPLNPSLFATFGPTVQADTSVRNYELGVSQSLELGGKRAARRAVADLRLTAALARRDRQRAVVAWRVQRTFYLAIIAQQRASVAAEADSVGQALRAAAQDRLALGQATQLELNVAAAAAARDRRIRLDAERDRTSSLIEFQSALGATPVDAVVPSGTIPSFADGSASPDSLIAAALRQRTDLSAVRSDQRAAEANVRVARALWWPDPSIGLSAGRGVDGRAALFSVAVPLPLWNNGQGQRAVAASAAERARTAQDSTERAIAREVLDASQSYRSAIASLAASDTEIINRLTENLTLARESFEAGKISLYTYNIIRRDLVEARLSYLDALADTVNRRYALALAVGEPWE